MGITDKIYTDKKGFTRVLPSQQRVADLVFRINSGWTEEEVSTDRSLPIEEVRMALSYYRSDKQAIDQQIVSIYGDWKLKIPKGCEPILQEGNLVGYKNIIPNQRRARRV